MKCHRLSFQISSALPATLRHSTTHVFLFALFSMACVPIVTLADEHQQREDKPGHTSDPELLEIQAQMEADSARLIERRAQQAGAEAEQMLQQAQRTRRQAARARVQADRARAEAAKARERARREIRLEVKLEASISELRKEVQELREAIDEIRQALGEE